jgi:hypothetical protein
MLFRKKGLSEGGALGILEILGNDRTETVQ